jgi:hypothetical protein
MNMQISIDEIEITISSNGQSDCKQNNGHKKTDKNSNRAESIIPTHFDLDETECRVWNAVKELIQVIDSRGAQDV